MSDKPLLLHVLYRFDTGGLENGVVNLINRLDPYRHAVLALNECVPAFCERVTRPGVEFISLRKPPGQSLKVTPAYLRELRRLQPALVHTRNLAALEMQLPTWWAGGIARLHGEHGRDADDLDGSSKKYQWMRRAFRPFVQHTIALSGELEQYLVERVGVPAARITRICNGVDTSRFQPAPQRQPIEGSPFNDPGLLVVGSVGRMQPVKGQDLLVQGFIRLLRAEPALRAQLRLIHIGDGPLRARCQQLLDEAGLADCAWLPGERRDVPALMRGFDAFVLPSLAEGISNTILEALASGLPVLATRVGGNAELLDDNCGWLIPAGDAAPLADGLRELAQNRARLPAFGRAARARAERLFSLETMVNTYDSVYARLLAARRAPL